LQQQQQQQQQQRERAAAAAAVGVCHSACRCCRGWVVTAATSRGRLLVRANLAARDDTGCVSPSSHTSQPNPCPLHACM
jgi:hypothetical protein